MKALIDGVWHPSVTDRAAYEAARDAQDHELFQQTVTADGSSGFRAEAGRYHLYVSYACPFAHRTILYRTLLGLEEAVSVSVLHPRWGGPDGWTFTPDHRFPEVTEDHIGGHAALWEVYRKAAPRFTGKVTVPVLWDKETGTIVSTESADIMRSLDGAFRAFARHDLTFRPVALADEVDALGHFVRARVNGAVYGVGFAVDQAAYDQAVARLFAALEELEARLSDGRAYLFGDIVTEVDWLLFPSLVRFDAVYHGALRCNLKRLADYPNLLSLTRRLHAWPGVAETVKLDHVKRHYYDDLGEINRMIVPAGPPVDFRAAA